jgi:hypothetical protein
MFRIHSILDNSTRAVLALSENVTTINALSESIPDVALGMSLNVPHYTKRTLLGRSTFPLSYAEPAELPEWAWERGERKLRKSNIPASRAESIKERAVLASAKARAFDRIIAAVQINRVELAQSIGYQDVVYVMKYIQAQRFKDSGYDESKILEIPYVLQYADIANIPLSQAADEILFKASLDTSRFVKTEALRLKFFRMIKEAPSVAAVRKAMQMFDDES